MPDPVPILTAFTSSHLEAAQDNIWSKTIDARTAGLNQYSSGSVAEYAVGRLGSSTTSLAFPH